MAEMEYLSEDVSRLLTGGLKELCYQKWRDLAPVSGGEGGSQWG